MGLASILGIRGARDKPEDRYRGPAYSFFFGRSSSGKVVNERTAMQATAVYSCVRILSEAIASLPVHLYRYAGRGKERVYDHPLYYLLHDEPNPEMTSFVFRETLMKHWWVGRTMRKFRICWRAMRKGSILPMGRTVMTMPVLIFWGRRLSVRTVER